MNKKNIAFLSVVIIIALAIFYAGYTSVLNKDLTAARAVKTNQNITDFSAKALNSSPYVHENKNPIQIYEVFASWCIPCRQSVPKVLDFAKFKEDVDLIGIAYRDVEFEIKKFMDEYGEFDSVIMANGSVEKAFGIRSIPQTIFVVDNKIVYRIFGSIDEEVLNEVLGLVKRELSSSQ